KVKNIVKMRAKKIATIITKTISSTISRALIGIHWLASPNKIKGVQIGASIVEKEVIAIESGRFPLARYTITFEAVPPGTDPNKTKPAANSLGKLSKYAIPSAVSGITTN